MKVKILLTAAAIAIAVVATTKPAESATMGCLLGAAGGGFGAAQLGKGIGQLAFTALGTLLGCGVGSSIQDRDQQRYQQQYSQPSYQYQPRPQPQFRSRYNEYNSRYQRQAPQPVQRACPYVREVQWQVVVGGRVVDAYGPGCSWDGGRTWQILSSNQ